MNSEVLRFVLSAIHAYTLVYMLSASCVATFAIFGLEIKKPGKVEKVLAVIFVPCFLVTLYRIAQSIN